MRWVNMLFVGLAPLLSCADAVDGAPAGGINPAPGVHRRALDTPDSPWHRRYTDTRRQVEPNPLDPNTLNPVVEGPPPVITVPVPTTTTTTTTSTDTTTSTTTSSSSSSSSTDTSSSDSSGSTASTDTTTSSTTSSSDTSSSSTSTTDPSLSIPIPLPLPTEPTATTTTDATVLTTTDTTTTTSSPPLIDLPTIDLPLPTISTGESTDGPIISISLTPTFEPTADTTTVDTPVGTPDHTPPGKPTTTPDLPTTTPTSSISSSSFVILSLPGDVFPNGTISLGGAVTTTEVETTTRPPITIETQYQFITATSFLIAPSISTSTTLMTETDPDALITSVSVQSIGPSATVTSAPIPSTIPMFITPPASSDHVAPGTTLDGYTEISILFQATAAWMWILQSSETAAQILAYMPPIIYTALNCAQTDIKTVGLSAFEPADTDSPDDLMTMWVGLIKSEHVTTLSAMIHTPTSEFYNTGDPLAQAIAKNVVAAYNIATINGVSNENGASTSTTNGTTVVDNSRRNAIIGVSTAFGVIALIVFAWWVLKTYKARQEGMHKRLSYGNTPNYGAAGAGVSAGGAGYGAGGVRSDSPPMLHNPFLTEREREEEARGIRRNSFYAIGPDDASIEEETFDYMSQHSSGGAALNRAGSSGSGGARWVGSSGGLTVPGAGGNAASGGGYGRRPVVGQQISQPILRESSMGNW